MLNFDVFSQCVNANVVNERLALKPCYKYKCWNFPIDRYITYNKDTKVKVPTYFWNYQTKRLGKNKFILKYKDVFNYSYIHYDLGGLDTIAITKLYEKYKLEFI